MERCKLFLMVFMLCCWHQCHAQLPPDILLDLNAFDNTTLDYTNEYKDLDTPVFLSDPNITNMTLYSTMRSNWTSIYLLIFNATINEQADLYFREAQLNGRLEDDYRGLFSRSQLSTLPSGLGDFDPYYFTDGMHITENPISPLSDMDGFLDDTEVNIALQAIGFESQVHPGYDPRMICVVAEDQFDTTTACVTLYFIGRNDGPPVISYMASSNASFTEGQLYAVPIVSGSLMVTDQDHPTRYPLQYARASIQGYMAGDSEQLSVTYENSAFSYQFDPATGILTITGDATVDVYADILTNITYFNNMTEPIGSYRVIILTVNDGSFTSNEVYVVVSIVNVNDAPAVSLSGEDPVITQQSFNYTEGSGLVVVAPNVTVVDTDPNAMIQRLQVSLDPVDGDSELISLSISNLMGLSINTSNPHVIIITGLATRDVYTAVLRSLSYEHTDAAPGNPTTTQAREIEFIVQDDQNVTNSQNSTLLVNILPVNDAPILLYVSDPVQRASSIPVPAGETLAMFNYTEDDPAINFGQDIYLRDVDGNVLSTTLMLTGLLDGAQDFVTVDQSLLTNAGLIMNRTRDIVNQEEVITIEGEATPYVYEEVLRSLTYQNLYSTNQVTDGLRNITIATRDDGGLDSPSIYAIVTVMDRNDGPRVNIGGGLGRDFTVTFIEDGSAVAIAQAHLTDIMDEEMHNISRLSLTLSTTNGDLDPGETIYIRSPMVDLVPYLTPPFSDTSINIAVNESIKFYENVLKYAYYYNPLDEPTILNANKSILTRVVVIEITDDNFVDSGVNPNAVFNADLGVTTTTVSVFVRIQPINDKRPRILINAEPGGCASDSSVQTAVTQSINRRRRDLKAVSRVRKRSILAADQSMAPKLISSRASFTQLENTRCLQNIELVFNANTSVPVLQVPKLLDQLVSFDPPELNAARKIGVWMDYRTMVVFFTECVSWPRVQRGGAGGGRERVVNVAFESERGTCTWSSPCEQGICFYNNTGCPVTGYYQINITCDHMNTPTGTTDSLKENIYSRTFFVIFGSAFVLFVVLLVAVVCKGRQRRNQTAINRLSASLPSKYSPLSTAIAIPPSITPSTQDVKPKAKSFIQEVGPPTTTLCDTHTKESTNAPTKMVEDQNRPPVCKSKKGSKKRNVFENVSETGLSSGGSENDSLLSDGYGFESEVDDGGGGEEERLRVCVSHDQSCDQSCDRIHDNSSGQRSTTNTSKDNSIDNSVSSNHSDRATRLSNNRQITPKAAKTTKQHSKH